MVYKGKRHYIALLSPDFLFLSKQAFSCYSVMIMTMALHDGNSYPHYFASCRLDIQSYPFW
jgi:hypothetical protein